MRHFIFAIIAATAAAAAQTPPPAPVFEVASIKPNKSGDGRFSIGMQPGGRFMATGMPVRQPGLPRDNRRRRGYPSTAAAGTRPRSDAS